MKLATGNRKLDAAFIEQCSRITLTFLKYKEKMK